MSPNLRSPHPIEYYRAMPKVDLHRHLEGSLRLNTLLEVGRAYGLDLPNTNRLRELVQIGEDEIFSFENFLSKFKTLRLFYRSKEVIARLTHEAVADAAADNVRYLELRFTPAALGRAESFPLSQVMDWVIAGVHQAEHDYGVTTRLIASVNRHEDTDLALEVTRLAAERQGEGVVGVDLAGDEANFSALVFAGVFKTARQAGLHVTIHAGEWGSATNVAEAITALRADRIGHGVRVLEDPAVTQLARDRQIPFEVCITSNYQSGVIARSSPHPIVRMLALGLNATINTDDPSISRIRLSDEYYAAVEGLGISLETLRERIIAAAQAAFLPENERQELVSRLQAEFEAQVS